MASVLLLSTFLFQLLFILLGKTQPVESLDDLEWYLPRVEVEFVCPNDIRSSFNATKTFDIIYKGLAPDINSTHLATFVRMSGMSDVPHHMWYSDYCNRTSNATLISFEVQGSAEFNTAVNETQNRTHIIEIIEKLQKPDTIKSFIEAIVCKDVAEFRSFTTSRPVVPMQQGATGSFDHIDHDYVRLCAASEDGQLLEDAADDPMFLFFAFMVGFAMVGMLFSELQKYDRRQHPLANRRRRQDYDSVSVDQDQDQGVEVEMV